MALFDFLKKSKAIEAPVKPKIPTGERITMRAEKPIELPCLVESKSVEYISFGKNNDYALLFRNLYMQSPIHAAICKSKANMIAGKIREVISSDIKLNIINNKFYHSPGGNLESLEDLVHELALQKTIYGAMCAKIYWSPDKKKIISINPLSPVEIALGKPDAQGNIKYIYQAEDWKTVKKQDIKKFELFNGVPPVNNHIQLMYIPDANELVKHYGIPSYFAGIKWIQMDASIATFHEANLKNGFNPGMLITVFGEYTEEQKRAFVNSVSLGYQGVSETGKPVFVFQEHESKTTEFKPIDNSNLDKLWLSVTQQIMQQIVSTHRVSTTNLIGVQTPGSLSTASDIDISMKIFENLVISPERRQIQKTLNLLAKLFGADKFTIEPNNIL